MRLVVLGLTGVGKSSFVNAASGKVVARVHPYDPCTRTAHAYGVPSRSGMVELIDTPGLGEDELRDSQSIDEVRSATQAPTVTAVLYVSRLDERRMRPGERRAIETYVEHIRVELWERLWLVLTFAAAVERSRQMEAARRRSADIADAFRKALAKKGTYFFGVSRCLVIDNYAAGWHPYAQAIGTVLSSGGS